MAFLGKGRLEDLREIILGLGEDVPAKHTLSDLRKIITGSKNYEEGFVREQLAVIIEERKRKEELEREEKRRKEELEIEEKRMQVKQALQEKELENEFLLRKMQLEKEMEHSDVGEESILPKLDIRHLMQKFDPKEGDISLYLVLFERQAKRVGIREDVWVSHLIGLLPYEMSQLIAREAEEVSNDFQHVKKMLLKRYKYSPEKFRQKFNNHMKSGESSWTDFLYELRNYFKEWLKGLEVETFSDLSDLIVTEQIKRRVPVEVKEHFIDEWTNLKSPDLLASKLDDYDSVRRHVRHVIFPIIIGNPLN